VRTHIVADRPCNDDSAFSIDRQIVRLGRLEMILLKRRRSDDLTPRAKRYIDIARGAEEKAIFQCLYKRDDLSPPPLFDGYLLHLKPLREDLDMEYHVRDGRTLVTLGTVNSVASINGVRTTVFCIDEIISVLPIEHVSAATAIQGVFAGARPDGVVTSVA
jgi:hypothetical protein